jgi:hypothetical protein
MMEDLKSELSILETQRLALFKEREPIDKKIKRNYDAIKAVKAKLAKAQIEKIGDKIDWKLLLASENLENSVLYKLRHQEAYKLALWAGEYWMDTRQPCLKVMMTYGDPTNLAKILAAVKMLTPFYTPHEDGFVWFGVFEHTLSEHGSYQLKVKPDLSAAEVHRGRYRESFGTLTEILMYIQKRHWYEAGFRDDD